MRPLVGLIFLVALDVQLAACQSAPPPDLHVSTLDVALAVQEADTIVLAYPVAQRDVRALSVTLPNRLEPLRLAEVETTLEILQVLKGSPVGPEIRFRFFDGRGYTQIGPPQGPSGGINARAIFFLKQKPDGLFRSLVDVFRPDVVTPWITSSRTVKTCATPSECVGRLLLTCHDGDSARSFTASLPTSVAIARSLIGFLDTFDLLDSLATDQDQPDTIRRAVCLELAGSYPLESPPVCAGLIGGTDAERNRLRIAANDREALQVKGMAWVEDRTGDRSSDRRYVELLLKSADKQTRAIAERLVGEIR